MQRFQKSYQFALHYQGQYYALRKPQTIIGSDPGCDICITDNPAIFPKHVQILTQDDKAFLLYLEHSAGIWVNGVPTAEKLLRYGDQIALGDESTILTLFSNTLTSEMPTQPPPSQDAFPSSLLAFPASAQQNAPGRSMDSPYPSQNASGGSGLIARYTGKQPAIGSAMPTTPQPGTAFQQPQAGRGFASGESTINNATTDATRYLCAAGHLDEDFQDYMLREVIHEERRALGESYGVDMLAVTSWSKAGLRRINIRDGILTFLLALGVLGFFFITIVINIVTSLITHTITNALNPYTSQSPTYYQNAPSSPSNPFLSVLSFLLVGIFLGIGSLILLALLYFFEKWARRRWPRFPVGLLTYPALYLPFSLFAVFFIPAIWLTIFTELVVRYYGPATLALSKRAFNPQDRPGTLDDNLQRKLQEVARTEHRNVIAYSGYKPFAGAGIYQSGWSFVLNTSQGAYNNTGDLASMNERLVPLPFSISDLYNKVKKDVLALGIKDVLEIEGKLYVNGQYLSEKEHFFNKHALRPVTNVSPELLEQYKEHPTEDIRYYQCLRFNFWRGEMIFTAFLRFFWRGKDLFTEIDYLLLPPIKPDYYWADQKEITPFLNKLGEIYKRSLENPIEMFFGAPRRLLRGPLYKLQQQRLASSVLNVPAFNYGTSTSARQIASDDEYHLFFQKLDETMYLKIVEKQILDTIVDFLDAHQIDTTELRQREQTILNSNTVFNGSVTADVMAFGSGAQANKQTSAPNPPQQQPGQAR